MLVLKDVHYTYPGSKLPSLSGIDIALPPGSLVAFHGDNGSGKTTLGLVLCGAIPWLTGGDLGGEVRWSGNALAPETIPSLCAFVFQDPSTYFAGHTAAEESALVGSEPEFLEIAGAVLGDRGLDAPLSRLSLGQQQLLAVASALMRQREIIILDEPFASVDSRARETICRLMKMARDSGSLVVVLATPEDRGSLPALDQSYCISRGKVSAAQDTLEEACEPVALSEGTVQNSYVLEATELSYAFPRAHSALFSRLGLGLRKGESLCVVGDNGVGKTTLLLLLAGLVRRHSGRVFVQGKKAGNRALRHHIKCAMQNPDMQLFEHNVRAELAFGLRRSHVGTEEIEARIQAVFSDLPFDLDADPFSLSYGQRKLLALASTFVLKPLVILLDEPLVGLDRGARIFARKLVERFLGEGGSLLIAAHAAASAHGLYHRVVEFNALRGPTGEPT